jgi:ribosome-binding protein aMBF1 (putative translation factor)
MPLTAKHHNECGTTVMMKETASEPLDLPAWPKADAEGNRPAVEFARVSIARSIAEDRQAAGLSQQELARVAGVRQETISRIESGKHSPTVRTVEKIERILQAALKKIGRKQQASKP